MPLRLAAVAAALALAPAALAQPVGDPPPTSAELAPGVVLTLDWAPFVFADHDAVFDDGADYPTTLDGCDTWLGYDGLPAADDDWGVTLAAATLVIDGARVELPTDCVIDFEPGAAAASFGARVGPLGLVEVSAPISDGAGSSTLGWVAGPSGARRFDAEDAGPLATQIGGVQEAAAVAEARLALALAATVAAERAAADARRVLEGRRGLAATARAEARRTLTDLAPVLESLGVAVPAAPPEAGALRLSGCAVVPDSAAADGTIPPGAGVTLVARAVSAEPVVAFVDLGDGTSEYVTAEAGAIRLPHAYARAGTYRATLTATDPGGTETCAVEVVVGEGEDPACGEVVELNTVYFGPYSRADLDARAEARVAENAGVLQGCPSLCVVAVGVADETDGATASTTRAEAVRVAYLEAGLAPDRIRAEGRGRGPDCSPMEDPGPGDMRCRRVESVPVACAEVR